MSSSPEAVRKRKAKAAFERKRGNRAVVQDTVAQCSSDPAIMQVRCAHHICFLPGWRPREAYPDVPGTGSIDVEILNKDCVSVAEHYCRIKGAKVWLLNMAAARKPGGGVMKGCNAQEEHLCRCSNLLSHLRLAEKDGNYPLHGGHGNVPDFSVLVHDNIVFFKNPKDYTTLPREQWFRAGVLTAAAEKVRGGRHLGPNAERFIDFLVDAAGKQECTHLVLSAWGCGAYRQCPHAVAACFRRTFAQLTHTNLQVTFAILDDHNSEDNLAAFQRVFQIQAGLANPPPADSDNKGKGQGKK